MLLWYVEYRQNSCEEFWRKKISVKMYSLKRVKGALNAHNSSQHIKKKPELPGPWVGPKSPAFWIGTQFSSSHKLDTFSADLGITWVFHATNAIGNQCYFPHWPTFLQRMGQLARNCKILDAALISSTLVQLSQFRIKCRAKFWNFCNNWASHWVRQL